jgi:hypothetical protein
VETLYAHVTAFVRSQVIGAVSRLDEPHRLALRGIVACTSQDVASDITYDSVLRTGPAFSAGRLFSHSFYSITVFLSELYLLA